MANTGVITYSTYSGPEPVRTFRLFTYAEYYLLILDRNPSELTYDFRLFTYAEYYSAYSGPEPVRTFRLFTYAEYYLLILNRNPSELTYDFFFFDVVLVRNFIR